jgi:thioredoxin
MPTATPTTPNRPVELTHATFEKTVDASDILVVDFWAPWCAPCRAFAPIFDQAAARHAGVTFAKVNTQAEPRLAAELQIQAIPTLMVFKQGIIVFAEAGMMRPAQLDQLLQQVKDLDMNEVRKELARLEGQQAGVA